VITKRIFVGGLGNAEAATQLALEGADTLAICLSAPRWNPSIPIMAPAEAMRTRKHLLRSRLCFCLNAEIPLEEQLTQAQEYNPEYYLADIRDSWPEDGIRRLQQHTQKIILAGFTLDYDDDASLVADGMNEHASTWNPLLFQLTLTPSRDSALQWFRDEAGEYDEDATLSELQRIVDAYPTLLNAVVDDAGGSWFEEQLPKLEGWFFWNGPPNEEARTPVTSTWEALTRVIRRG
jgi:hypothetical protein